ncbi:MAG: cyclic nucleotide-binding domain-containing protein, partial [Moorea sp. SIO2I5]|nr:cyclic nucleotide-binding domain-containing protein [Moorena sp. SIO2I5]
MVKSSSAPMISAQQLSKTLGCSLSPSEFQRVLKRCQFKEPKVGKFWHAGNIKPNSNPNSNANTNANTNANSNAGIYIIIAGKVRLLDGAGELIATLATEESFGELTLFPEVDLEPYLARASVNLKLCFLPADVVLALMDRYPQIRDHLWNKARLRDSQCQMGSSQRPTTGTNNPSSAHSPTPATPLTSGPPQKTKSEKKIKKAFFPHPTQRVGHWFQRVTRRYPFYAQQSASDCGAACLVMVSRYWGKQFSLNRLRKLANVNRDGSSLRGMCFAAESVGFSTRPVQATLDQLAKQKLPAIVHWQGKHFIVVYEITKTHVVVCDPALEQRTLTHREFNQDWSGYALLLQPTLKFKDTKASSTSVWQFFELIKPHWLMLLEIFIASIFLQLFGLVTPIFTQLIL